MKRHNAGIIIIFALLFALGYVVFAQSCEEAYRCEDDCNPDSTSSWTAPDGYVICQVNVKPGQKLFVFTEDGCQEGYCVEGIGTQTASTERTCDESPKCQAVSHTTFFIQQIPPTQTPTNTPEPTSTETIIPTGTLTPTVTSTITPTATSTMSPTRTSLPSPTATQVFTPTSTASPTATNPPTGFTPTPTPNPTESVASPIPGPTSTPQPTDMPEPTNTPKPEKKDDKDKPKPTQPPMPSPTAIVQLFLPQTGDDPDTFVLFVLITITVIFLIGQALSRFTRRR